MVKVRLSGGLGNQLFQVGGALDLVDYDASRVTIYTRSLGDYKEKRCLEFDKLIYLKNINIVDKKIRILDLRLPKFLTLNTKFISLVSDKNYSLLKKKFSTNTLILDGYFQESISQEVFDREINFFKNSLITPLEQNLQKNCVIHIRGNDFVELGWSSQDLNYYKKAIEQVNSKFGINNFIVVTDDKKYSISILKKLNVRFEILENKTIIEDFLAIGMYQYRILSSSTFCLWASALGNNSESVVYAPIYWRPGVIRQLSIPNEIKL